MTIIFNDVSVAMFRKTILGFIATLISITPALAGQGYPRPWELNFQPPASIQAEQLHEFHNLLLVVIFGIVIFVIGLMAWVVFRYNEKANPEPSKFTHNTLVEVIWTIVPVMILIVIAIPSFKILFYQGRIPDSDMTIKTIGYQWYWGYEYPDHGGIAFTSYMIPEDEIDAAAGQRRLLETDTSVIVPVGKAVRLQVTAADVIHSWAVPALGVKKDAIPGRLNEVWFRADKIGTYYGQCSEICGAGHSYMPIKLEVVSQEDFDAWVLRTQAEQGIEPQEVKEPAKEAEVEAQNEHNNSQDVEAE